MTGDPRARWAATDVRVIAAASLLFLAPPGPGPSTLDVSNRYRDLDHISHSRGRHASLRATIPELFKPHAEEGKT